MAGAADVSHPHELSVADFSGVKVKDDGSLTVRLPLGELKEDPNYPENRLRRRMATTMIEAMTAAFACELAIKAICLTCNDEAKKTHDLLDLFEELPEPSRERIELDFPEIEAVMRKGRQTFGAWRYFEKSVGEEGVRSMIDVEQARALAKAARVILDEALMVGLSGSVNINAQQDIRRTEDTTLYKAQTRLNITGGESPPVNNQH